jgi:hypothetical protein
MLLMDIKQRDLRNYSWVDTVPGLPGLVFREIQDYGMAPAHRLWGHQQWHSTVIVINLDTLQACSFKAVICRILLQGSFLEESFIWDQEGRYLKM